MIKKLELCAINEEKEMATLKREENNLVKPREKLKELFQKIGAYRVVIEENELMLATKQEEIRGHVQAIVDHVRDSRQGKSMLLLLLIFHVFFFYIVFQTCFQFCCRLKFANQSERLLSSLGSSFFLAEIQFIVEQHQTHRDALLLELDTHIRRIQSVEKLRADRVQVHGQAELDRRYQQIERIVQLKIQENIRRDAVNRNCTACKKAVGCKADAAAHNNFGKNHPVNQYVDKKHEWKGCPSTMDYFVGRFVEKTIGADVMCPEITFTCEEDVDHVYMEGLPGLDGSFWHSEYEKDKVRFILIFLLFIA